MKRIGQVVTDLLVTFIFFVLIWSNSTPCPSTYFPKSLAKKGAHQIRRVSDLKGPKSLQRCFSFFLRDIYARVLLKVLGWIPAKAPEIWVSLKHFVDQPNDVGPGVWHSSGVENYDIYIVILCAQCALYTMLAPTESISTSFIYVFIFTYIYTYIHYMCAYSILSLPWVTPYLFILWFIRFQSISYISGSTIAPKETITFNPSMIQ